eukprot:GHVP01006860.1.p2 GENE.GHVP01006860.1~~GHVP01006860.1.p2  ORF type:complete len:117 (-),score=28.98 GHVP01006860.1:122-472(-)
MRAEKLEENKKRELEKLENEWLKDSLDGIWIIPVTTNRRKSSRKQFFQNTSGVLNLPSDESNERKVYFLQDRSGLTKNEFLSLAQSCEVKLCKGITISGPFSKFSTIDFTSKTKTA